VNKGEWRLEVRGIAAPVFDVSGRAVAAIGVCSPASGMPDRRIAHTWPIVVDVARRLSAQLGAPANGRPPERPAMDTETTIPGEDMR
jgi:DNA-binding IclR family transcriptional regulator